MVNTIYDKAEVLVRDFGLELILEQNDLTEEQVVMFLISGGLIDLDEYFYNDSDEAIWEDDIPF